MALPSSYNSQSVSRQKSVPLVFLFFSPRFGQCGAFVRLGERGREEEIDTKTGRLCSLGLETNISPSLGASRAERLTYFSLCPQTKKELLGDVDVQTGPEA